MNAYELLRNERSYLDVKYVPDSIEFTETIPASTALKSKATKPVLRKNFPIPSLSLPEYTVNAQPFIPSSTTTLVPSHYQSTSPIDPHFVAIPPQHAIEQSTFYPSPMISQSFMEPDYNLNPAFGSGVSQESIEGKMSLDLSLNESVGSRMTEANKEIYKVSLIDILNGNDARTTLMIKNIPNKYNQKAILNKIDIYHASQYNFFYLPMNVKV